jgi:crotonobetainyl-CoA:carnitine CoA-transferase CaiB-like acyl-CoA transferase
MLPLDHIRVIDLTRLAPGPHCTMILADMGADVIRIEEPGGGRRATVERGREDPDAARQRQRRAAYQALDRNKRSITLNLKVPEAREALYDLVRTADVVVEGYRPGVVQRLGVDYDTLAKINPRIIGCSISGYGQDGPYRLLVGHDINYIALAGALGITGQVEGPPAIPANLLADYAGGGMHAALGILLAIIAREKTGRGQNVDISMADGVVTLLAAALSESYGTGVPVRRGAHRLTGLNPYYAAYECADGKYISVGANEPWFYENLCRALGGDQYLGDHAATGERREQVRAFFREAFRTRPRDEWFAYLFDKDVCVAPVYDLDEVEHDPQIQARQMIVDVPHPTFGPIKQAGLSVKLSDTPGSIRHAAPRRGEHTDEVLTSLGWDAARISALRSAGGTESEGDGG